MTAASVSGGGENGDGGNSGGGGGAAVAAAATATGDSDGDGQQQVPLSARHTWFPFSCRRHEREDTTVLRLCGDVRCRRSVLAW